MTVRAATTARRRIVHRFGEHSLRRTVIGVAVLLALAFITWMVFARHKPWEERWTITATFADSTQIRTGSPVRMAGVRVGEVTKIARGPGNSARVTLDLEEEGRSVRTDAVAEIRPRLFLEGSYYVALQPGSPSAGLLGEDGVIPLRRTSTPVQLSPVLSSLTASVRADLTSIIRESSVSLADGGARGLKRSLKALGPAFRSGAVTLEASRGQRDGDLTRLVAGASRVTNALADRAPQLAAAITDLQRVASTLASSDDDLRATLVGVDRVVRAAPPALRDTAALLPELRTFARDVGPAVEVAPAVLRDTVPALRQLRGLVAPAELPRLLDVTGPLAARLVELQPRLRELMPRVERVARCAGDQGIGLLNAKVDDGKLSTGQPSWQELAHASVSGTSLSQSFDGNGNYLRAGLDMNLNALSLGSVPGVGVLLGDATRPITGTRPVWDGPTPPPLRPDVPCRTQPLPSFASAVGPSGVSASRTVKAGSLGTLDQVGVELGRLARALRKQERVGR